MTGLPGFVFPANASAVERAFVADIASELASKDMRSTLVTLAAACARLIRRVEQLEARPALAFKGTWSEDLTYRPGDICRSGGSSWFAVSETKGVRPTHNVAEWALVARAGRDGRDAPTPKPVLR